MSDHTRKVNDTWPPLSFTLSDQDGAFDMSSYRARFVMTAKNGTVIADGTTSNGQVEVLDATAGRVRMNFDSTHVDTPGNYLAEWELSDPLGRKVTFPSWKHISISLKPELASS